MFSHPLYFTFGCSILLSFVQVIFIDRSVLAFCARFLSFPYWAVIFTFIIFKVIRDTRETRAYRLLHTIYHENAIPATRHYSHRTPQPDEFGLSSSS